MTARLGRSAVLSGLIGLLATGPALATSPVGKDYKVTVFSSFQTVFSDCLLFANDGRLTLVGLPFGDLLYRLGQLDHQRDAFQAGPTQQSGGFVLTLHGTVFGAGAETIQGNMVSSDGDTFIFQGVVDSGCATETLARQGGGSSYRR